MILPFRALTQTESFDQVTGFTLLELYSVVGASLVMSSFDFDCSDDRALLSVPVAFELLRVQMADPSIGFVQHAEFVRDSIHSVINTYCQSYPDSFPEPHRGDYYDIVEPLLDILNNAVSPVETDDQFWSDF